MRLLVEDLVEDADGRQHDPQHTHGQGERGRKDPEVEVEALVALA